jgi:hypothetical protein
MFNLLTCKDTESLIKNEKKVSILPFLTYFYYLCKDINIHIKMRKYLLLIIIVTVYLSSCSNNKTKPVTDYIDTVPMMIMQIQKCSRLYTAEYRIHKIVTHDDQKKLTGSFLKHKFDISLPMSKRKVAIPMDATLKAYIDFDGFSESNIKRRGNKIEIILPDPKVMLTSSRINNDEIKQYVALTRSNFSDEELTDFERQGRQAIINEIPDMGIIDMARENAAATLIPILAQMGYQEKNVTITFRKEFSIRDLSTIFDKSTIENGKAK